mmetsp:Transcript_42459/g.128850  ORF Transcript_42459/g.128850 Transcript_42459/m.128850 type:complete len:427 (-) Transcript_42459:233-1513(-)
MEHEVDDDGAEQHEAVDQGPIDQQLLQHPHPNILLELMEEDSVNWRRVIERLQMHPDEAAFSSRGMGYSAINKALWKRAPLSAIQAIVNAHPQSVLSRSAKGVTPLHIAVVFGTFDVTQFIFEANLDAASQRTINGTIPLHGAKDKNTALMLIQAFPRGVCIRGHNRNLPLHAAAYSATASPEVVKLLIGAGKRYRLGGKNGHGGILVKNEEGDTPLSLVCKSIESRCGWYPLDSTGFRQWGKLMLIARAAYRSRSADGSFSVRHSQQQGDQNRKRDFRLLHSVIGLRCPAVIIWHALNLYPHQIQEHDQHGRYPLAIASMNAGTESRVIKMLLLPQKGFVYAAAIPLRENGRLPLTLSIVVGRNYDDGMRELLRAAPNAIEARDQETGLYPFMLAAVGERCNIYTVYLLLLEAPRLVHTTYREKV